MSVNKINTTASRRTASGARGAAACIAALLLVLASVGGACRASAKEAAAGHRRTILVLPFDLFDYSLDQRAVTVVPLRRWVSEFAGRVAGDLPHAASLRALGGAQAIAALRKVRLNYHNPTECRACMVAIARRTGARLVVVGQVHKLSNLITFFKIEIDDVRTGRVLHVINMRADGADTDAMWRRIALSVAHRVQRAVADGR